MNKPEAYGFICKQYIVCIKNGISYIISFSLIHQHWIAYHETTKLFFFSFFQCARIARIQSFCQAEADIICLYIAFTEPNLRQISDFKKETKIMHNQQAFFRCGVIARRKTDVEALCTPRGRLAVWDTGSSRLEDLYDPLSSPYCLQGLYVHLNPTEP